LEILREKYKKIIVSSIGDYPEDESWKYWLHMKNKNLVDILLDSQGDKVS
jgi:hypothetical protein